MVQWDTLLPENKQNTLWANPLPTFTFRARTTEKNENTGHTVLLLYYATILFPPPSCALGWDGGEKRSKPDTTACACCAFPCALPAARQSALLRTGNYQPNTFPNPSDHITPLSPKNCCLAILHKLHMKNYLRYK